MDQVDQEFDKPNPDAPAVLSRFAFLVGRWQCEAKVRLDIGQRQTFRAGWLGRFILDGIADGYRDDGLLGRGFDGQSIIYALKEPVASHAYTRATYTNISRTHFTWRGEKSDDGKAWSEFMVVEAYRREE